MRMHLNVRGAAALLAAAFSLLLPFTSLNAQHVSMNLNLELAEPEGAFHDNVKKLGVGVGGGVAYHFGDVPIALGLEGGILGISVETRNEPFSPSIPEVSLRVTTSHNLAMGHAFVRLQPASGFIRPYVDGVAGIHDLFTTTSVNDATGTSSTNKSNIVFAYGARAGIMVPVYQCEGATCEDGCSAVMIDIGAGYMHGATGEYLRDGGIHRDNGNVTYDITSSETNLITGHLGVVVQF
ncbi:MAG TPA: outer membrane beta-barrel protein [Candidatus Kapabacteria bacterium]|nr:outer membrane beta-barrel protein [Candidatus Kapabacteria bacterium]